MRMKHMLLEGFCDFEVPGSEYPCVHVQGKMGLHCVGCKAFSYTSAPNELALSNDMSVIETIDDFIAADVDIYDDSIRRKHIDKWNEICRIKIRESIEEYETDTEK